MKTVDILSTLLVPFFISYDSQAQVTPQATLPIGSLAGIIEPKTGSISFLGIQYGKASRWESPIPVTSYGPSVYQATKVSLYGCAQSCVSGPAACPRQVTEDCLSLNVWTPFTSMSQLQNLSNTLPVLTFIYGGTFTEGSSTLPIYDGAELSISLNAIVVSFDYRVSVFGFPGILPKRGSNHTSSGEIGVNLGIQDQRLAIQWTQKYISFFGGNSSQMTLMGHSAGALSSIIHLSHPYTRDIFANAILMSPPSLPFRPKVEARHEMGRIAVRLGCASQSQDLTSAVWDCLEKKTSRDILNAYEAVTHDRSNGLTPIMRYMLPVIDAVDIHEHPFITLDRPTSIRIILGTVANETARLVDQMIHGELSQVVLDMFSEYTFESRSSEILSYYPQLPEASLEDRKPLLSRILSDRFFECPAEQVVQHAKTVEIQSGSLLYRYVWRAPWLGRNDETTGTYCPDDTACHVVDLLHLFWNETSPQSRETSKAFRAYVSQFIRTGIPGRPYPDIPEWLAAVSTTNTSSSGWISFRVPSETDSAPVRMYSTDGSSDAVCKKMNEMIPSYQGSKAISWNTSAGISGTATVYVTKSAYYPFWMILIGIFFFQAYIILFVQYKTSDLQQVHQRQRRSSCLDENITLAMEDPLSNAFTPNPMKVAVNHLDYSVFTCGSINTLLADISFECAPGTFTAIMGPSGCGKTSLLSILARQLGEDEHFQAVYYNRRPLSRYPPKKFNAMVSFVAQHDPPFHGLTPRQILTYNAMLQLPKGTSSREAAERAALVLDTLSLNTCADIVIQSPGSGKQSISGGQMRRVAIAVALLQEPSVLLLDEPTSGLDAKSSLEVIQVLSKLSARGFTVIVSIHQPRLDIFEMFNNILLLNRGRRLFFGVPSDCAEYMRQFGRESANRSLDDAHKRRMLRLVTQVSNPADMIMDVLGNLKYSDIVRPVTSAASIGMLLVPHQELDSTEMNSDLSESSSRPLLDHNDEKTNRPEKSHSIPRSNKRIGSLIVSGVLNVLIHSRESGSSFVCSDTEVPRIGIIRQAMIINARWWSQKPFLRKMVMPMIALFATGFLATLLRRPTDDIISLMLIMKGIGILTVGFGALKNISIGFDFYEDLDAWLFDRKIGLVCPTAFFLHRLIYETCMGTAEAMIAGNLSYFLLGIRFEMDRYQSFMVMYILFYNVFIATFTLVYATRLGRAEARSVSVLVQTAFAMTCGLLMSEKDTVLYSWLSWLRFINPLYYSIPTIMRSALSDSGDCLLSDESHQCVARVGDALLKQAKVHSLSPNTCIWLLLGLFSLFRSVQWVLFLRDVYGKHLSRRARDAFQPRQKPERVFA